MKNCRVCKVAVEVSAAQIKHGQYLCAPCRRTYRRGLSKTSQFAKDWQRERDRRRQADPAARLKANSRALARKAIYSGRLIRQPCEVCAATTVEAHHDDYSKPLEVRWMCPAHHHEHHANEDNNRGARSAQ